ncbi:COPII-coated vesicle component Erp2/3/4 [Schizosaccharomyces osmophilus]|uniref:COPII-coated vesicle component Erp2/3/4 n=1 Tax=Schizosaccharomyces osmophilus TaxID=2545709 RepID=A0AAE9W9U8_9SCHI|nr:COPII-coated vesicle component Erp2/3/4 [Schizosaccharomyces osmophilus]WBW72240.1 COPII-coated vesicle component Erp2/3/4 [Schizosaccharomyces osmophilus]
MRFVGFKFAVLLTLLTWVHAIELTFQLENQEQQCYHIEAPFTGEKCHFTYAVQSGGSFDVDYSITAPSKKTVALGKKRRQADIYFSLEEKGEYDICFDNHMSAFTDKILTMELVMENEMSLPSLNRDPPKNYNPNSMQGTVMEISTALSEIDRIQTYFRTRESRNFSTVQSTESRILWFSIAEALMVVGLSSLQVFIVKTFFKHSGRRGV